MKKLYEKPDAEYIKLLVHDAILNIIDGSFGVEEDPDEEGI